MSVIVGKGYGDCHEWDKPDESQIWLSLDGGRINPVGGPTVYRCVKCGEIFHHFYHDTPDIFEAMRLSGIRGTCVK